MISDFVLTSTLFARKSVDVSKNSLIIELTGNVNKIEAFINLLDGFDILEMVRTGLTGLGRGKNIASLSNT